MSENTPEPAVASPRDADPAESLPQPSGAAPVAEGGLQPPAGSPSPTAADDEILDAVIVDDPTGAPASSGVGPAFPVLTPTGYTDAGVPTLDYVQDRIEARIGRALGTAELDQSSEVGRTVEKQAADREQAAKDRLAAIRKSLGS